MEAIVDRLLAPAGPSIRYKVRSRVLGGPGDTPHARKIREEIRQSDRVRALPANRSESGRVRPVRHVYKKWIGAHWVFATPADIGYPPGDAGLAPVRDQVTKCRLNPEGICERVCHQAPPSGRDRGVPIINGRARRCASQQGNALYSAVSLGLADDRCREPAGLLMRWQWPDGGWPAEERFYKAIGGTSSNAERVSWGGANAKRMNEWAAADALYVLHAAGRL